MKDLSIKSKNERRDVYLVIWPLMSKENWWPVLVVGSTFIVRSEKGESQAKNGTAQANSKNHDFKNLERRTEHDERRTIC
jgi:hypothetical protein